MSRNRRVIPVTLEVVVDLDNYEVNYGTGLEGSDLLVDAKSHLQDSVEDEVNDLLQSLGGWAWISQVKTGLAREV